MQPVMIIFYPEGTDNDKFPEGKTEQEKGSDC